MFLVVRVIVACIGAVTDDDSVVVPTDVVHKGLVAMVGFIKLVTAVRRHDEHFAAFVYEAEEGLEAALGESAEDDGVDAFEDLESASDVVWGTIFGEGIAVTEAKAESAAPREKGGIVQESGEKSLDVLVMMGFAIDDEFGVGGGREGRLVVEVQVVGEGDTVP